MVLKANAQAPDFTLTDQSGASHSLSDYKGRYVVVYFYPRAGSPGCTQQACGMRDNYPAFEERNVAVLGISIGAPEKLDAFAQKHSLPFTLLSDLKQKTAKAYGAKGFFFPKRISYLIGPTGLVIKSYPNVEPSTHANVLLEDIRKAHTT